MQAVYVTLTQGQVNKLLEMCKALFPGYTFSLSINAEYDGSDHHIYIQEASSVGEYVHWFEFCTTHLINKFYYPDNVSGRATRAKVEYFLFQTFIYSTDGPKGGYQHPVDYLYEQFLKME